ncbi:sulfite exporter TauE/SafE family protein [Sutcliffiella halmapala]|uniref:sulfite exporter TauE/SafE family protein n=1 Tax=Sutcliffiella halmapala TaxID=79882 RepID=UPI000994DF93|nr:sulfite exporter TauE/SafE family protein [Sutcliffiella halmapala]
MEFILLIILGFSISMLSGFFGIGGGFVLTPILLLLGYSPLEAISTSLLYTIGTSIAGVYAHYKMKNILWKEALIIGLSGVVATQIAFPFVSWLEVNNYSEIAIPFMYLSLLSFLAFKMLSKVSTSRKKSGPPSFIILITIGLIAGFLSTTLGVGGGFIIVPLLITFYSVTSRQAVATSLASVILIVSAGFITYAMNLPKIHYETGLLLIVGAIVGTQLGARATIFVKNESIPRLLGFLYIVTITGLILKMYDQTIIGLVTLICYTLFVNIYLAMHLIRRKVLPSY